MRRMITGKLIEWIKSLKDKIHQNGNTTEIGGNVEVDGDLQVNSSILDSEGDEAIDIGTSDISIHKNVNVGSVDEPEDLFVSGEMEVDEASTIGVNLTAKIQEIAGGGGSGKYAHFITLSTNFGTQTLLYIDEQSSEYTLSTFANVLYTNGYDGTKVFNSVFGSGIGFRSSTSLSAFEKVWSSNGSSLTLAVNNFSFSINNSVIEISTTSQILTANSLTDKVIAL